MKELNLVSTVVNGKIDTNFNQFLEDVKVMVEPYVGLVFTDEQMGDAKKTVAELNKVKTEIQKRTRDIKKTWLIPFTEFDGKIKKAVVVIDEALNPLKAQVSEAEEARIIEKKQQVSNIINAILKDNPVESFVRDCVWFYNEKWELKGTTLKKVKDQATILINSIEANLNLLTQEEFSTELVNEYRQNGDITTTLLLKDRLTKRREEVEELAKRKMWENQQVKEAPVELFTPEPEQINEPTMGPEDEQVAYFQGVDFASEEFVPEPPKSEPQMTINFSITGTRTQLVNVRDYCIANGLIIQRI